MRISDSQFNVILERYLIQKLGSEIVDIDILKVKYASQFKKAVEFIEANVNEDLLNLVALGASEETTFELQKEKFALFCEFLDAVIIDRAEQPIFHKEIAIAAKAKILDPNLSILKVVQIYDQPNNLGIREKYSRGLLTSVHWLTDTDLQRMLALSDTKSEIGILPFTATSLGASLNFARKENVGKNEPYTIPYILNVGGGHWIAAKITINPLANTISYVIEDSLALPESAKKNYEALIDEAIKYDDGFHKAYPNAIIDKASCHINGNAEQKDGYSCGYRAFQFLMKDPAIHKENPIAKAYGELDEKDSANLVRAFYTAQLQDFALPKDIYDVLNSKGQALFSSPLSNAKTVKVKSEDLQQFISQLPEKITSSSPDTLHKSVEDCVGKYTPGMVLLRFPPGGKIKDLDAIQYSSLFEELASNQQLLEVPLPNFILASCDFAALDGLNSFYAEQSPTLFRDLEIAVDLEKSSDADVFAAKLNFALNNLSRTNLNKLAIKDEKGNLSEKHIQELIEFTKKQKISFSIDLPETYRNSQYQKQLDEIVSINRREKNSHSLAETLSKKDSKKEQVKVIRSREKVNLRSAMKIDIELQEGIEETATIAKVVKKRKAANDYSEIKLLRLNELQEAAHENDFSAFKSGSFGMTKSGLIQFWHQVCGNVALGTINVGEKNYKKIAGQRVFPNTILSGISDKALEQLIEHKDYFKNGINISQLPQGFVLISDPKNPELRALHYDENLEYQNTIAPQVFASSARQPLSLDLVDKLLKKHPEKALISTEAYSRENSEIFRKYLPELLVLSDEQYKSVIELCSEDEVLNFKKLDFVFKNLAKAKNAYQDPYSEEALIDVEWLSEQFPETEARQIYINFAHQVEDKVASSHPLFELLAEDNPQLTEALKTHQLTNAQYNGLLAIYDKYGVGGLEKLQNTWERMDQLLKTSTGPLKSIKANTAGYESTLLNDDLLNAVKKISGFSKEQRQWWEQLYAAHQPVNDNLTNLINSFTNFSQSISEMGLRFYDLGSASNFSGAGNLPTALGRMLSILHSINPEDRKAQWEQISKINLSATGAIFAIMTKQGTSRPCGFVLPEMGIDGQFLNEKGYDTYSDVKDIPVDNDANRAQGFYRYIAHQKYRLPLDFYQEAVKGLETARLEKSIPNDAVDKLYTILAEVTTGDNYRYFIDNPNTAMDLWKGIIANFQKISIPRVPGITTDIVKATAIEQIAQLPFIPPLPVLSKLVNISTTPLQNVGYTDLGNLKTLVPKLEANNRQLISFVQAYENKIYLGMKFYGEDDFKKTFANDRNIFEEHMELSRLFHEKGYGSELLPLISTFKLGSDSVDKIANALDNHSLALRKPVDSPVEQEEPVEEDARNAFLRQKQIDNYVKALSPGINQYLTSYVLPFLQDVENNNGLNAEKLENLINSLAPLFKQVCENYCINFVNLETEYKILESELSTLEKGSKDYVAILDKHRKNDYHRLRMANNFIQIDQKQFDNFPHDKVKFLTVINQDVFPFLEKEFKANFPENYFENLRAGKPKAEIQLLIDKSFKDEALKDLVSDILAKFQNVSEQDQLLLVSTIASICEDLSKSDKESLFKQLTDPRLLSASISQYNQLLQSIDKYGVSNFIYFVEIATQFEKANHKTIDELVVKTDYFLSQAMPQIRNVKIENLTELDVVDLVVNLVLAAKNEEIEKKYDLAATLVSDIETFDNAILSKNPEKITSGLKEFSDKYPDFKLDQSEAVKQLEAHLAWFQEEEFKEIEQTKYRTERRAKESVANTLKQNSLFGGLFKAFAGKVEYEDIQVAYTEKIKVKVDKKFDPTLGSVVVDKINDKVQALQSYNYAVSKTLSTIENMVKKYPSAKKMLLEFTQNFLSFSESDGTQVEQALANLALIHKELTALNNKDIVISICEHFSNKDGSEFNYKDFIAILQGKKVSDELDFQNYPKLSGAAKAQILKVITSLLNNDKPCSLKDIQSLINNSTDPNYVEILEALYEFAPFPTLDLIYSWIKDAANEDLQKVKESVIEQYNQWNKNPVARECGDKTKGTKGVNGFDFEHAKVQVAAMQGIEYTDEELKEIEQEVERVRTLSTKELLEEIGQLKDKGSDKETPTKLVALLAELLYRTKGLPQEGVGNSREWGRSFEINTTQYLAIHSMLKTGGHVTSQIGTGEGKSRIMMIAIAAQYTLGNTVDFVTSDLSLATRDYLEYQAYFKVLGAETNLIYANTPANEYRIGGINFSDASNLSLFRNKARSEGNQHLVLDPREEKRALMLDEADKTYFDSSDTRFNYSAQADASIRDIPWIYELLVEFLSKPDNEDLYYANADLCNEAFYNFARSQLSEVQMARLVFNPKMPMPVISRNQLEAWQSSALTALALEVNNDFTIIPEVKIQTKEGVQKLSQAQLISGGRASGNAKFSFGVHQCLHARLNMLNKNTISPGALFEKASELISSSDSQNQHTKELNDINLQIELMNCSRFNIDSENQIVYSSSSKALVDDYSKGALVAVTGSMGGIQEQEEAGELYGKSGSPMTFIDVPRHRGLKREDLPVLLANDQRQHYQKILDSVRDGLGKNPPQPILLVCENDTESQKLYDFLNAKLSSAEKANLQRISAKTRISDEAMHVNDVAGKPGAITISTAMLGRGTDIKLHKEARVVDGQPVGAPTTSGLRVIGTYLPKGRDYIQIIGRAGRFGALGESQLVLDKQRVTMQIGKDTLPTEFYTATEEYLVHLQKIMEADKQKQRIVKNAIGDFRLKLTNQFFEGFYAPLSKTNDKDNLLVAWQAFFDKTDKSWNETWPAITRELDKSPANMAEVKRLMFEYQEAVKDEWNAMKDYVKAQIKEGQIKCETGEDFVNQSLNADSVSIGLRKKEESLLDRDNRSFTKGDLQTTVASNYSDAYVGRAVIYTSFIDGIQAFFNNIGAAMRGDGPWFPNLKAAMNGNMSWTQFFFGTWGSPLERSTAIEITDNGSYKTMVGPMKVTEDHIHHPFIEDEDEIAQEGVDQIPVPEDTQPSVLSRESDNEDEVIDDDEGEKQEHHLK